MKRYKMKITKKPQKLEMKSQKKNLKNLTKLT
jgi:hypothetical protein